MTDMRQIERDLDHSQQALTDTLGQLRDRLAPEALTRDGLAVLQSQGTAFLGAVDRAIRTTPGGFALAGLGLALIAYGNRQSHSATREPRPESLARWEDEGGPAMDEPIPEPKLETSELWSVRLRRLRARASARLADLEAAAADQAHTLRDGIADTAGHTRDFAAEKATLLRDYVADTKATLADGLGDLSDAAQKRILATRESAWAAMQQGERLARQGAARSGQMITDHPLLSAAVGLGLGAALAAALPRSRMEDRRFGAESDRLMAEAARMLREERARLSEAAQGVGAELGDATRDAVSRVADRAADELARQHKDLASALDPNTN